jgi:hypothetical protein
MGRKYQATSIADLSARPETCVARADGQAARLRWKRSPNHCERSLRQTSGGWVVFLVARAITFLSGSWFPEIILVSQPEKSFERCIFGAAGNITVAGSLHALYWCPYTSWVRLLTESGNLPDNDPDQPGQVQARSWLSASELGLPANAPARADFKRLQISLYGRRPRCLTGYSHRYLSRPTIHFARRQDRDFSCRPAAERG